jgi:hypothetical protein
MAEICESLNISAAYIFFGWGGTASLDRRRLSDSLYCMVPLALVLALHPLSSSGAALSQADQEFAVQAVKGMQKYFRGPYEGVRWFCKDGAILMPKSYACKDHGGGIQHGVLGPDARRMAKLGVHVGTILSSLRPSDLSRNNYYRSRAYIVESYLERALDGWTLKAAKSYRGFRQVEDEIVAARWLLIGLLQKKETIYRQRSLMVRLVRALPYGTGGSLADTIRAIAGEIGDADPQFEQLRFKIHAMPEPADAEGVDLYIPKAPKELKDKAITLRDSIRKFYDPVARVARLKTIRNWIHDTATRGAIDSFVAADFKNLDDVLAKGLVLLVAADKAIEAGSGDKIGERNLLLLHCMGLVEQLWMSMTADIAKTPLSRQHALQWAHTLAKGANILGVLSDRELGSINNAMTGFANQDYAGYAQIMRRAARVVEWGRARYIADLGIALPRYAAVEPDANRVIDDLLRSGITLPLSNLVDRLSRDADQFGGGSHKLVGFAEAAATVLRGENPGLARGLLRIPHSREEIAQLKREEIVLLHDLPPELPPVAGILTLGDAGSLSHVSLLARNLGIPHATVGSEVSRMLQGYVGQDIAVGVSAARRVVIGTPEALAADGLQLDAKRQEIKKPFLKIDASILDLKTMSVLKLSDISEKDSGVRVGPKAAELGRLKRLFPDRVSDAVVIPFGLFLAHVDRARRDGAPSPIEKLREAYQQAKDANESDSEKIILTAFETFRDAIAKLPFAPGFEADVLAGLKQLGTPGRFGVFVRSDTNVEDLKEFTGAGLNKTVANRVKVAEILSSIRKVWASPFTERSFRWRQKILMNPEAVYPSVILHKTIPAEKSGVLVTTDLETGDTSQITISASEGVAAVVDGGAPETVVLGPNDGVRLLSSCRAITRKLIPKPPQQSVVVETAMGLDPLLTDAELAEIRQLTAEVLEKIPPTEKGVPWDIEFGLLDGKAYLMQIRPLRVSKSAGAHPYLLDLDAKATFPPGKVNLTEEVPL